MLDPDSLERLVPEAAGEGVTGRETLELHLERYRFAAGFLRPGRFLDLACGVGYGSRLLLDSFPSGLTGVGVDVSPAAVAYANENYADERLSFRTCDAFEFGDEEGFETVVSLETIEHIPDPCAFAARLESLVRPGGTLIASAPVTPSVDANPHHLTDFTPRRLRRLFDATALVETDRLLQIQPYSLPAVLGRSEPRMQGMRRGLLGYYAEHPGALLRRIGATLRYGCCNRYLTLVFRKLERPAAAQSGWTRVTAPLRSWSTRRIPTSATARRARRLAS